MVSRAAILTGAILVGALVSQPAAAGSIGLAWNASPGATGYRVHYGPSATDFTSSVDIGNQTRATIDELQDCTTWYFAVSAYNSQGESGLSQPISSWPRPVVTRIRPSGGFVEPIRQGSVIQLTIEGTSFREGGTLELDAAAGFSCPASPAAAAACQDALRATVRVEQVQRISCLEYSILATIEPTAAGQRPARVGNYDVTLTNPAGTSASGTLTVSMNEARFDINRQEAVTDGRLDGRDIIWMARLFGNCDPTLYGAAACSPSLYDPDYDFDGDGRLDGQDLELLTMSNLGRIWDGTKWACPPGAVGCTD